MEAQKHHPPPPSLSPRSTRRCRSRRQRDSRVAASRDRDWGGGRWQHCSSGSLAPCVARETRQGRRWSHAGNSERGCTSSAVAQERWCAAAATATRGGAGRGHVEIRRRHGLLCRRGEGMGNKMDEIQGLEVAGGCLVLDRANIVWAGFKTAEKFGR